MMYSRKAGSLQDANVPITRESTTEAMAPHAMHLDTKDTGMEVTALKRALGFLISTFSSIMTAEHSLFIDFASAVLNENKSESSDDYIDTLYNAAVNLESFVAEKQKAIAFFDVESSELGNQAECIKEQLALLQNSIAGMQQMLGSLLDYKEMKTMKLQQLIDHAQKIYEEVGEHGASIRRIANRLKSSLDSSLLKNEEQKEAKAISSSNNSCDIASNIFELEFDEEITEAAKSHPESKSSGSGSITHSPSASSKIHVPKLNSFITDSNLSRVQHINAQTFNVTKQKSTTKGIQVGDAESLENFANHPGSTMSEGYANRYLARSVVQNRNFNKCSDDIHQADKLIGAFNHQANVSANSKAKIRALSPDDQLTIGQLSLDDSSVGSKDQSSRSTSSTEKLLGALSDDTQLALANLYGSSPIKIVAHHSTRAANNHPRVKGGFNRSVEPDQYLTGMQQPFGHGKLEDFPLFPVEFDSPLESVPVTGSAEKHERIASGPMPPGPNNGSSAESSPTLSPTAAPSTKITVGTSSKSHPIEIVAHHSTLAANNHPRVKGGFNTSIEPDPYLTGMRRPFGHGKLEDLPPFPLEFDSPLQSVPVTGSAEKWIAETEKMIGSCPLTPLQNNGSSAESSPTLSPTAAPSNSIPSTQITVGTSNNKSHPIEIVAYSCTRQPKI